MFDHSLCADIHYKKNTRGGTKEEILSKHINMTVHIHNMHACTHTHTHTHTPGVDAGLVFLNDVGARMILSDQLQCRNIHFIQSTLVHCKLLPVIREDRDSQ